VVEVAEVLLLLVGVRREVLTAGEDLHAAQPARALADARGVDLDVDRARARVEQRGAFGDLDDRAGRLERDLRHPADP
jgi:hypothetical protein